MTRGADDTTPATQPRNEAFGGTATSADGKSGAGPHPWALPEVLRRKLVAASRVRPLWYWADLLLSAGLGWSSFFYAWACRDSPARWAVFATVSALAFLRAAYFIHELAHRTAKELPLFSIAWHTLVGVPVGLPALMMWPHREHHRPATYGTLADPEYAPVPSWDRRRLVGALLIYGVVPALLAVRWGITPWLSHAHPKMRRHAIAKVSTADIYHRYERPPVPADDQRAFYTQEWFCFLFVVVAMTATVMGHIPWGLHLHRYAVMALALVLNHSRLLVVHRYEGSYRPVPPREQTLDTWTMGPDSVLTELIAPLGSRFHALHHELPTVPYHDLGALHRMARAELPADHPYIRTEIPGFFAAWRWRWREAAHPRAEDPSEGAPVPT